MKDSFSDVVWESWPNSSTGVEGVWGPKDIGIFPITLRISDGHAPLMHILLLRSRRPTNIARSTRWVQVTHSHPGMLTTACTLGDGIVGVAETRRCTCLFNVTFRKGSPCVNVQREDTRAFGLPRPPRFPHLTSREPFGIASVAVLRLLTKALKTMNRDKGKEMTMRIIVDTQGGY